MKKPKTPKPRAIRKDAGTLIKGKRKAVLVRLSEPSVIAIDADTAPGVSRSDIVQRAVDDYIDRKSEIAI